MKLVSVVMPMYNCRPYVAAAIESVLAQTYNRLELIVINDGSTDGSDEVARRYLGDPRVRLVSRENRGITATRNEALELSQGEYMAIADADDVSLPQRLERQVGYMETHPECVWVGCRSLLVDPDDRPLMTINDEATHEELEAACLAMDSFFVPNAYTVRTQALRSVGGYRKEVTLAEDRDLCLRLAERGRLHCLPEVLYRYRQHMSNTCVERRQEVADCAWLVVSEGRRKRGMPIPPRPAPPAAETPSPAAFHRKWAWWAIIGGHATTAIGHAARALVREPLSAEGWNVLARAAGRLVLRGSKVPPDLRGQTVRE